MLNRSTLTKWVTGLLGAMLALGPAISPAQALPSGDRAERCNSTLQQAEGINYMSSRSERTEDLTTAT